MHASLDAQNADVIAWQRRQTDKGCCHPFVVSIAGTIAENRETFALNSLEGLDAYDGADHCLSTESTGVDYFPLQPGRNTTANCVN